MMCNVIAIVAVVSVSAVCQQGIIIRGSWCLGKEYEVCVSIEQLRRSPEWDEKSDDPPLSARKAIKLANCLRAKSFQDTADYEWKVSSAAIHFFDEQNRCVWEIDFEANLRPPGHARAGPNPKLIFFVLMDGTVVQPQVVPIR